MSQTEILGANSGAVQQASVSANLTTPQETPIAARNNKVSKSSPAKYISMEDSHSSEQTFADCLSLNDYLARLKTFDQRGRVELIMGTMFAGKSTELLRLLRKHEISGKRVLKIKFVADTRYADSGDAEGDLKASIVTHNGQSKGAIPLETLS